MKRETIMNDLCYICGHDVDHRCDVCSRPFHHECDADAYHDQDVRLCSRCKPVVRDDDHFGRW